ncbi:MAG: hypothetical protein LBT92_02550, partial [Rickettsiales bacterium]|nr:hypothetical protein [Rickettsiales bacterium]
MKKSFMKTLFSRLVYKNKDAIYDLEAKKTAAEEQVAELSAEKAKAEAAAKELNIALKKSNADLKAAKASADGLAERLREREDEFLLSGRASAKIVSNYGERRLEAFDPASNQWKNEEVDYDNVLADTIAANFAPDEFMEVPHGAYVKLSSYTISKNRQAVLFAGKMPENHGNYKFECAEDEEAPQIVSTDRGHGFVRINASTGYPDHFHTINIFDGKRFFIVDESNQTKL